MNNVEWVKNLSQIDKVEQFEKLAKTQAQVDLEVKHHFSYGVYARELFIPKGVILTGHIHKYPQLNFLVKGEIEVSIDGELVRLKAPQIINSPAGTKRVARTLEDTIWITVHPTDTNNLDAIEKTFIAHSKEEFLDFVNQEPQLPFIEEQQKCLT